MVKSKLSEILNDFTRQMSIGEFQEDKYLQYIEILRNDECYSSEEYRKLSNLSNFGYITEPTEYYIAKDAHAWKYDLTPKGEKVLRAWYLKGLLELEERKTVAQTEALEISKQ